MGCGYEDDKAEFLIKTFELKCFPYVCRPYTCNVLLPRVTLVGVATRACERDDYYPICSKLYCGGLLTLCGLYYACSYTVAIFPGPIYSFAVLYTENLAFQCVTLQSCK